MNANLGTPQLVFRGALSQRGALLRGFVVLSLSIPFAGCVERDVAEPPPVASSTVTTSGEEVAPQVDEIEPEVAATPPLASESPAAEQGDEPDDPATTIEISKFSYGGVATERIRIERAELPDVDFADLKFPKVDEAHVEELIASLADLEKPDFGLSSTLSGTTFLPLPGREEIGTVLLVDHRIESYGPLVELVKLGPAALPALLAHLDDKTPTKLAIVRQERMIGSMTFANELRGNPLNTTESEILLNYETEGSVSEYTVKVGDVCLVAIGQITGRDYKAVRYQPTLCIVLNSPTRDVGLCEQVRQIWGGEDPRRRYFDFMLLDYTVRGRSVETGEIALYQWSDYQCSAAMRLLYYFPDAFAPIMAERIDDLYLDAVDRPPDVAGPEGPRRSTNWDRETLNEVATKDFLEAVLWSDHPAVVAALRRADDRTTDLGIRDVLTKRR